MKIFSFEEIKGGIIHIYIKNKPEKDRGETYPWNQNNSGCKKEFSADTVETEIAVKCHLILKSCPKNNKQW